MRVMELGKYVLNQGVILTRYMSYSKQKAILSILKRL